MRVKISIEMLNLVKEEVLVFKEARISMLKPQSKNLFQVETLILK